MPSTVYFNAPNQYGTHVKGSLSFEDDGIKIVKEARGAQAAFGVLGAALAGKGDTTTIRFQDIASVNKGKGPHVSDGVILRLNNGEMVEIKSTGWGSFTTDEIVARVQERISAAKTRCPVCGEAQEMGYKFCSNCGATLKGDGSISDMADAPQNSVQPEGSKPSTSYAEQHTEKKDQGGRIALIVVGIIVIFLLRSCANAML